MTIFVNKYKQLHDMKKILCYLSLAAMIIVMAAGCSKSGNDDADSLIKTVPADASSVVVVNLERTLDKLGCSTDGKTIKLQKIFRKPSMKASRSRTTTGRC